MPDNKGGTFEQVAKESAPPPVHPLDEMWYVQGDSEVLGPYRGNTIRELIDRGSIGRTTGIATVGSKYWTEIGDVPAFARHLPDHGTIDGGAQDKVVVVSRTIYAGFWIRLLAALIDFSILFIFGFVAALIAGGIFIFTVDEATAIENSGHLETIISVGGYFLNFFYYIYFLRGPWQATPGKRLCGLHVVRINGAKITAWLAFGRSLAYLLSAIVLGVGFLMIGWTNQKKGLHDIVCGTRVVHGKL